MSCIFDRQSSHIWTVVSIYYRYEQVSTMMNMLIEGYSDNNPLYQNILNRDDRYHMNKYINYYYPLNIKYDHMAQQLDISMLKGFLCRYISKMNYIYYHYNNFLLHNELHSYKDIYVNKHVNVSKNLCQEKRGIIYSKL